METENNNQSAKKNRIWQKKKTYWFMIKEDDFGNDDIDCSPKTWMAIYWSNL